MGNRVLKESIKFSDEIDRLSPMAEVAFYRLLVTVDDYGRYFADPMKLKHMLFPTKDVDNKIMEDALCEWVDAGLVEIYVVQGKEYLQVVTWGKHQQIRNKHSKFPAKEDGCEQEEASDGELIAIDINCVSESESESESKTESESLSAREMDSVDWHLDSNVILHRWGQYGFVFRDGTTEFLEDMHKKYGADAVVNAIMVAAENKPRAPEKYLRAILENDGAKVKVLNAQSYTQREYAEEPTYMDKVMGGG